MQEHKTKQPYYIHYTDERVMAMAGLYDNWKDAEGNWLTTFTILTTDSSKRLQWCASQASVPSAAAWSRDRRQAYGRFGHITNSGCFCCRLHDRMPVLLPTEELEAAWLADEAPDAK